MIQQIPQEKLMDYWTYYTKHKLKNMLALFLTRKKVKGFIDDMENPKIIMFLIDWACYITGNSKADNISDFLVKIPEKMIIFVPNDEWEIVLKNQWKNFGYSQRTEFSAESLSLTHIRKFLNSLPEKFQVKKVDIETAKQILAQNLFNHWVREINSSGGPEKFVQEGIGYCIKEGAKIVCLVSGAKGSIPLTNSLELDISTLPEYRGRGFATILSAKLIEHCLEKDFEPHWDTGNPSSFKLAKKLGYSNPEPYKCYYWRKESWNILELKSTFDPQFKNGLENINRLKTEIDILKERRQVDDVSNSLLSSVTKAQGIFEEIFLTINRLLETEIVKDSDIPQFKEYVKSILRQLDTLECLKTKVLKMK